MRDEPQETRPASPPEQASPSVEAEKRSRGFPILAAVLVAALAVLAALAGGIFLGSRGDDKSSSTGTEGILQVDNLAANHVTTAVTYPQTPPLGGPHHDVWQNCGFYAQPVASENAVHSLEHGAVWITYQPDLPPAQVEQLRQIARGQTYVLVTAFPGLPAPVVASAWGRQLRLESAGDERLAAFVRQFRSGRQAPEPGAPCFGGIGEPQ